MLCQTERLVRPDENQFHSRSGEPAKVRATRSAFFQPERLSFSARNGLAVCPEWPLERTSAKFRLVSAEPASGSVDAASNIPKQQALSARRQLGNRETGRVVGITQGLNYLRPFERDQSRGTSELRETGDCAEPFFCRLRARESPCIALNLGKQIIQYKYMILTRENIFKGATHPEKGGFSRNQLQILGIDWPPVQGWLSKSIGKEISPENYDKFVKLRRIRAKQEVFELHLETLCTKCGERPVYQGPKSMDWCEPCIWEHVSK